ncbi:MAG: hypothetical protein U0992_03555 [Planctomycetaceae bacterium]
MKPDAPDGIRSRFDSIPSASRACHLTATFAQVRRSWTRSR